MIWAAVENGLAILYINNIDGAIINNFGLLFNSIGKVHSRDYERYTFEQLKLSTHLRHQPDTLSIMPNTVTPDILPFNTGQFSFVQKLYEE